eukprot:CAMPEP_0180153532 /NCGR_PEP_ID=MMETSP0986-20121125/23583_1 /TAXON_ID=697907 /ORGANISM="non described non described, Strain CCMP2293" /LENGTH=126 /DNA_ID=CAMNT_0022101641 /DNA_START=74 /DNA_END=455 /DNA_ORIENTATION=-
MTRMGAPRGALHPTRAAVASKGCRCARARFRALPGVRVGGRRCPCGKMTPLHLPTRVGEPVALQRLRGDRDRLALWWERVWEEVAAPCRDSDWHGATWRAPHGRGGVTLKVREGLLTPGVCSVGSV